jgi:hypothetical protein
MEKQRKNSKCEEERRGREGSRKREEAKLKGRAERSGREREGHLGLEERI